MKNIAGMFFTELFNSDLHQHEKFLEGMFPYLESEQSDVWGAAWSSAEIKKALGGMGSWKAPGADGFQPGFFKKSWEITGPSVNKYVVGILKGEEVTDEDTEAMLVLIPKEAKPMSIKSFRPISLCNVSIKLVMKVIANRLKTLMKDLGGPNQASFIPGRQSLDNVIICQELVYSLRYTTARKGGMILKIDLQKAYDMMEWSFVEETVKDARLPLNIIQVVMRILRRSSSHLVWNGETTNKIVHTRELRQGDPMSPYLFMLCLERLSQWINLQVAEGRWRPLRASRGGLKVSHLFLLTICFSLQRQRWSRRDTLRKASKFFARLRVKG